eukprot:TRINITY_DN2058_c0_g1_i1.p1 TRINITY_DN2058_c0_g1~~TRINITY_DN2058_c0_g1_i1.p1  ORF type:complete len:152 (-),score=37.83 TRINITY_DN2058_c0_g1_i1:192-647(-)
MKIAFVVFCIISLSLSLQIPLLANFFSEQTCGNPEGFLIGANSACTAEKCTSLGNGYGNVTCNTDISPLKKGEVRVSNWQFTACNGPIEWYLQTKKAGVCNFGYKLEVKKRMGGDQYILSTYNENTCSGAPTDRKVLTERCYNGWKVEVGK